MNRASISYTQGYFNTDEQKNILSALLDFPCKRVLTNWSPAYDFCMLASGSIEGIINNRNEPYDFVAGKLLVSEAGGKILYTNHEENTLNSVFVASNESKEVASTLMEVLERHVELSRE